MSTQEFRQRVRIDIENHIAHVRMIRSDKYNALDLPMLYALIDAAKWLRPQRDLRAIILSGEGGAFSTGLDVASVTSAPAKMFTAFFPWGKSDNIFQRACWAWRQIPVPVVAVLHGHCYGGALQIALAADFRFSTPDCKLSIMEIKWGLVPDMTGTLTLRELMPMDAAKKLAMTGEVISGKDALNYQLVTELHDDPMAAAEALCAVLSEKSPDALGTMKVLLQSNWHASPKRALARERLAQLRILLNGNQRLAAKAALKKQVAKFKPRKLPS